MREDVNKFIEKSKASILSDASNVRIEPITGFQKVMVRTMTESLVRKYLFKKIIIFQDRRLYL